MTHALNLPTFSTELVRTPEGLVQTCERLRSAGTFAFDTEFIGENTYQPILCLIQVATSERVELIDAMAISREAMQPFWGLLSDPELVKICHAGDQDVEIAAQHGGNATQNMFDTQIGAGMLGIAYPTALWRVVEHFTGITLEKAHTYSAWDRRPLTGAQLSYAVDDVRYLPLIHAEMLKRIEALGHGQWMRDACKEMCDEAVRPVEARKLFMRIRGAPSLKSEELSVLREVTALREQIAYEHDLPARKVMKDEVLFDIATRRPNKAEQLGAIRDFPRGEMTSYGKPFLDAIARGIAVPPEERPSLHIPAEDSAEIKRLGETLWVAAQAICLGQSVTPSLVTSQNEIMTLARLVHKKADVSGHALMAGWHRECLGEKLTAFIAGKLPMRLTMQNESMHASFAG